ncbi:adenylyl-sulfate kinase [Burkholderia vietnamiensis]|uniref:adenylyl-sulfate kinase n=1 Tax=Burkholderia vietnamiensis TaxID=60552 RepID=UPI00075798AA|nr:adenylyl-sulfate kinase [Burkholderia vietnamiensis]KVR92935.1 adenylyl-sulfate kinase [Burkholderia vietnamiensis]MCA8069847.1 adenylyl-sulfate kinase [Burkholderia vietnamiensis]UEC04701.1 adenylyl-sulfate kinase [Burkholderia vietnamiensis]HDR8988580.1 adenylyl-sulfate kinase [Burkholderia vietnamiensis]
MKRESDHLIIESPTSIRPSDRAGIKGQHAFVVWLTGLSGAGKSTLANLLEQALHNRGLHTALLDGDGLRLGLNKDLGFSDADRRENIRRTAEAAKLMVDAGLIVIVAIISPIRGARESARRLFGENEFFEVFVDAPVDVTEARDVKGLYALARQGAVRQFTGVQSIYEVPLNPDIHVHTALMGKQACIDAIVQRLPIEMV